jgi:cytidine deaminase
LGGALSVNPFSSDAAVPERLATIDRDRGNAVRTSLRAALAATRRDLAGNMGGVVPGDVAASIADQNSISWDELMLLGLGAAEDFSRPPISDFHVGAIGRETGTGNLVFGGNLEFPGAPITNTVHGEGFVFCRSFSRGTTIETIAIGEAHPCAHCRQFLSEFAAARDLILIDPLGHRLTMAQLYPWPFDPAYLGQTGIVPGTEYASHLEAANSVLRTVGRRSYTPYGKGPAAVVLTTKDGHAVTGAVIESVAFNPTMTPLQTALIDLYAHGFSNDDIAFAILGATPGASVDYVSAVTALLISVAPGVTLDVQAWS